MEPFGCFVCMKDTLEGFGLRNQGHNMRPRSLTVLRVKIIWKWQSSEYIFHSYQAFGNQLKHVVLGVS